MEDDIVLRTQEATGSSPAREPIFKIPSRPDPPFPLTLVKLARFEQRCTQHAVFPGRFCEDRGEELALNK